MKAAVCFEHNKPLILTEVNIKPPAGKQVKVKVAACAICHSDIHYMEGAWQGQLPAIFGHEAAGVVEQVGDEVSTLKVGDRVIVTLIRSCGNCFYCDQGEFVMCADAVAEDSDNLISLEDGSPVVQGMKTGAFAEYVVVDESQIAAIPENLPMDVASLLACGVITGAGAVVNTAKVEPGSSVVVVGVGGVGLNSIQASSFSGANRIIAVDIEPEKLETARLFGATHTLDARKEKIHKDIKALTEGRGADYVFVTVGSGQAIDISYRFVRRGGTVVIVGMPASDVKSEFSPLGLAGSVQTIKGSFMGQTNLKTDIPKLLKLYEGGKLKLDELVSNRYTLDQVNEAIENTLAGKSLRNVLIVDETI
jgi:S-(hydroxymethyl)glutathione dehydrogenase/alcohol dehydrogenase